MPTMIVTDLELYTTLTDSYSEFVEDSVSKFENYINEFASLICDETVVDFGVDCRLGRVNGSIYLNVDPFSAARGWRCSVIVDMECSYPLEKVCDNLWRDRVLCDRINIALKEFVREVNKVLKAIQVPTHKKIVFGDDGHFYIEEAPYADNQEIEYIDLGLRKITIDESDLEKNSDILPV